jgi:dTDP-4-amino-4,6-dideoxygalactose transaminase
MNRITAFPLDDYLAHQTELDEAVNGVLRRGVYILGQEVAAFEEEFAAFVGVDHAVGVANGTDAIELMLRALEIGQGHRVVVPSHTAVASAAAIVRAGAEPIFVDVEPVTQTLCPAALEGLLNSDQGANVRAVLAVHLYGHPCDMEALQKICARHGITLLEDCAQGHGADYQGRKVGSIARAAAFSFYPTKNLGAVGDGGAVVTSDKELAERIHILRQYGWVGRYISDYEGVNSRLDELQAAILRVKLRTLPQQLEKRRSLADWYRGQIHAGYPVRLPEVKPHCLHAWHLFVVRSDQRDELHAHMTELGVPVAIHYPQPIHRQAGYAAYAAQSPALPTTELLAREVLTLPLHPYLKTDSLEKVTSALLAFQPKQTDLTANNQNTLEADHV